MPGYLFLPAAILLLIIIWFLSTKKNIGWNKRKNYSDYQRVGSLTNGDYLISNIEKIQDSKFRTEFYLYLDKIIEKDGQRFYGHKYRIKLPHDLLDPATGEIKNKKLKINVRITVKDNKISVTSLFLPFSQEKIN